jgi:hypothetical protein
METVTGLPSAAKGHHRSHASILHATTIGHSVLIEEAGE